VTTTYPFIFHRTFFKKKCTYIHFSLFFLTFIQKNLKKYKRFFLPARRLWFSCLILISCFHVVKAVASCQIFYVMLMVTKRRTVKSAYKEPSLYIKELPVRRKWFLFPIQFTIRFMVYKELWLKETDFHGPNEFDIRRFYCSRSTLHLLLMP